MLIGTHFHTGRPPAPHDLWSAWTLDPVLIALLVVLALPLAVGKGPRRPIWHGIAVGALFVALVSPLEALSRALASAHMVQHLLLLLIAAPALAWGGASQAVVASLPIEVRRLLGRLRRERGLTPDRVRRWLRPGLMLAMHAAVILIWHVQAAYEAALDQHAIHLVQHATMLGTGALFWSVVLAPSRRAELGTGVLALFALALQSVFLALLMTFATSAWYPRYADSTEVWGLTPLADQHLAGAIMWVPAGLIYTGAGLSLLVRWLRSIESSDRPASRAKISA